MKLLTMVSTVLLPTTLILGFFATSFQDIPLYSRAAFIVMCTSIALVTATLLYAFRRQRWI